MQPAVEIIKSSIAQMSGLRRPYLSLRGPKISCPAASPMSPVVSPSWTSEVEQPNQSSIAGSTGMYMSMTKGPKALSAPRNIRTKGPESMYFPPIFIATKLTKSTDISAIKVGVTPTFTVNY